MKAMLARDAAVAGELERALERLGTARAAKDAAAGSRERAAATAALAALAADCKACHVRYRD